MNFAGRLRKARETGDADEILLKSRLKSFHSPNLGASAKTANSSASTTSQSKQVESYTGFRLSTRYISKERLESNIKSTKVYTLPEFLSVVAPPEFSPPKDANFVLMTLVAAKGEVKISAKNTKYTVLTLCDLEYDISLSVHGKCFEAGWKIQPGTLIALLNPRVYIARDIARSLALSVFDSGAIMEIGHCPDVGQCLADTAKANRCKNWVNLRITEICVYHQELRARKASSSRPEFNSVVSRLSTPKAGNKPMSLYQSGNVKWKSGLHPDSQLQCESIGKVYQSGGNPAFFGDYDHSLEQENAKRRVMKRRKHDLERESHIRDMLAKRPEGYLMREFDVHGNPLADDSHNHVATAPAFSAADIRRIGYDPTKKKRIGALKDPQDVVYL